MVMLSLRPMTVKEANRHVARLHRHNRPTAGGLFAAACEDETGAVRGVMIVGRPVARYLQDGWTCEVLRVATDGAPNACSLLYGAAARAAKALGYRRVVTYTLAEESGASLRAAGFERDADLAERPAWDCLARDRVQTDLFGEEQRPAGAKVRWVRRPAGKVAVHSREVGT
jgi:hypothetical protein